MPSFVTALPAAALGAAGAAIDIRLYANRRTFILEGASADCILALEGSANNADFVPFAILRGPATVQVQDIPWLFIRARLIQGAYAQCQVVADAGIANALAIQLLAANYGAATNPNAALGSKRLLCFAGGDATSLIQIQTGDNAGNWADAYLLRGGAAFALDEGALPWYRARRLGGPNTGTLFIVSVPDILPASGPAPTLTLQGGAATADAVATDIIQVGGIAVQPDTGGVVTGEFVAYDSAGAHVAGGTFRAVWRKTAGGALTIAQTQATVIGDAALTGAGLTVAVVADGAGGYKLQGTGVAATNLKWFALVRHNSSADQ